MKLPPPHTSKMEVIGTHVLPYAPPHGLGFSGFLGSCFIFPCPKIFWMNLAPFPNFLKRWYVPVLQYGL